MITGLKKNKFTQTLATGAAAIGVLAGVGLAGAPAQAGIFRFDGGTLATHPSDLNPPELWEPPTAPQGYINPTIYVDSEAPDDVAAVIEYTYLGSDASFLNKFVSEAVDWCNKAGGGCVAGEVVAPGTKAAITVPFGLLPFHFIADANDEGGNGTHRVNNGGGIDGGGPDTDVAYYFAAFEPLVSDGTPVKTGKTFRIGLSDGFLPESGDADAEDFVLTATVKQQIKATPEPGTVLGLLAVGGLGAFMKRKQQG